MPRENLKEVDSRDIDKRPRRGQNKKKTARGTPDEGKSRKKPPSGLPGGGKTRKNTLAGIPKGQTG
jgi:hypothetical protein